MGLFAFTWGGMKCVECECPAFGLNLLCDGCRERWGVKGGVACMSCNGTGQSWGLACGHCLASGRRVY